MSCRCHPVPSRALVAAVEALGDAAGALMEASDATTLEPAFRHHFDLTVLTPAHRARIVALRAELCAVNALLLDAGPKARTEDFPGVAMIGRVQGGGAA